MAMERSSSCIGTGQSILAFAVVLATALPADTSALAPAKPTPTPVEEVVNLPDESEVQRLLSRQDTQGAAMLLAKIRVAARARGDWVTWFQTLLRESQLLSDPVPRGPGSAAGGVSRDLAIRVLSEEPEPPTVELRVARLLLLAQLHDEAAESASWGPPEGGEQANWSHAPAAHEAFAKAFSLRAALGSSDSRVLRLVDWEVPTRPTARDIVTYRFVGSLFRSMRRDAETAFLVAGSGVARLLGVLPERAVADRDPLVRIAALLDDLERWHLSQNRREAALEALLERRRILYQVMAPAGADQLIVEDLRQRLRAFRDVPWWAMGVAQLALFANETSAVPEIPLGLATAGAQAYPNSEGGKRCATIARILGFERDDPEVSIVAARTSRTEAPELIVTHRGAAVLHLRAWPRPIEDVTEDRWPNFFAATNAWRSGRLPQPTGTPIGWTAALPPSPDRRPLETVVIAPIRARGLYRVEASLSPDFAPTNTGSVLLLVSDLALVVAGDVGEIRVRVLSVSTGCPLPGARVRLLERRIGKEPRSLELASATTRADGVASFPWPDRAVGLAIVAVHGNDVAHVSLGPHDASRSLSTLNSQPARRVRFFLTRRVASPGESVSWWVLVQEESAIGLGAVPVDNLPFTVSVRDGAGNELLTDRGRTGAFGTASGALILPPLGVDSRDGGWKVELTAADATSPTPRAPLASRGIAAVRHRPSLAIGVGPTEGLALGHTARVSGIVVGEDGRPTPGAAIQWVILAPSRRVVPPRIVTAPCPSPVPVARGRCLTGADGSFTVDTKLPGPSRAEGAAATYQLRITASDGRGRAAAIARSASGFQSPCDITFEGPQLREAGDRIVWRVARRIRLDGMTAAGESTVTVSHLPVEGEVPLVEFPAKGFDPNDPNPPNRMAISTEKLLEGLGGGATVAKVKLQHDISGRAWLEFPPLPPGYYRVSAESPTGNGGVAHATRPLVVAGGGRRLPQPLGLLADDGPPGQRRVFVSAAPDSGDVILELYSFGHLLEARTIASPAAELIEIPRRFSDPVAVRAITVFRGRLIALEKNFGQPSESLVVTIESVEPELRVRLATAAGAPVMGAEVTVVGLDSSMYPFELDGRRHDFTGPPPLILSGNGFGVAAAIRPLSAVEWGTTRLAPLPTDDEARRMSGSNFCGTGLELMEAIRPALPLQSGHDRGSRYVVQRTWSEPIPRTDLVAWAPRLVTDSQGRAQAPAIRVPATASLRVAASALTRDGRAGYIDTLVEADALASVGATPSVRVPVAH